MAFKSREHVCKKGNGYVICTTMSGVREIWIVYEPEEDDRDEAEQIIYEVTYCPFCGEKLK